MKDERLNLIIQMAERHSKERNYGDVFPYHKDGIDWYEVGCNASHFFSLGINPTDNKVYRKDITEDSEVVYVWEKS
jgi:hypothetical protein